MLIFDDDTLKTINSLEVETLFLYEIIIDDATQLYFTNYCEDFIFDNKTYKSVAIKNNEFTSSIEGQINDITISLANANRIMQYYIENYDLIGKKIRVMQFFRNCRSYIVIDVIIKAITATNKQVDLTCGLAIDVFNIEVGRTIFRDFCKFQFRGEECKYNGQDETCSKHFIECLRKNNIQNFGGFPAIVSSRYFV